MRKKTTIKTYKFLIVLVVFLFVAIIAKLCYVVLSEEVDGIDLKEKQASVTTARKTLYASRGEIYDRFGETLARTINSYTLIAYLSETRTTDEDKPQHVVDKEATARALAPILEMSEEDILKRLNKNAYQVEFGAKGKGLTDVTKEKIEELNLPGIDFITSTKRYYNKGEFASYIIGYAKEDDSGEITGELGVEKFYNGTLAGVNGYKEFQKYTASNYQIPNTPENVEEAKDGSDIYLTIDSNIQLITEKSIKSITDNYENDWVIFSVMDAETGAIVASATSPNFNPNDTNTIESYMNPLVSYQYEPGSVMKIFSFASAIEEGVYDGSATYQSGSIDVADVTIRDAERAGWGTISFDTGFAYSSNVASTTLALKLGTKTLRTYYQNLGFGKLTGIELSNEVEGDINFLYKSELATASFGQGITVTPIQMLQALTMVTNKGTVLKPYIVDKIVDSEGNVTYEGKKTEVKKVYSEETIVKMQSLMHNVIYEGLTKVWQPTNVKVIGKTGTAQIAAPTGGYLDGEYDYIKSFAGIFPEENPKYIIYVAVKSFHGTTSNLADVVKTTIEEISSYAKITESESDIDYTKIIELKNYISKNASEVATELEQQKIKPIVIGSGNYIINQYPLKSTQIIIGSKIFLLTNNTDYIIPDMMGWSMSEVKTYCNLIGLKCNFNGYGYVINQSIPVGTIIEKDLELIIDLQSKIIE